MRKYLAMLMIIACVVTMVGCKKSADVVVEETVVEVAELVAE